MALSDASADPLALSNGGHHPLGANGNAPSNTSTPVSLDPLTAASNGDCPAADGDEDVLVKDAASKVQQKQQSSHVVQRTNRPSQNGGVAKQNGSLRNLPPSSAASSSPATIDSKRLAKRHLPTALSPSSSSPPLQPLPPPLCCQHCHFHSTLCCPCGQQECPLFQNPGTGPGPGSVPHPGSTSTCPCCLSACTYTHSHPHPPPHPSSPLCLHHHHHQRWQEHLQNQTPGIRSGPSALSALHLRSLGGF